MGYSHGIEWTDEKVRAGIFEAMDILSIKRMPTSTELISLGLGSLHCRICRSKKYFGWATELNLDTTQCETRTGQQYEQYVFDFLSKNCYKVERMTTKYPYDLLVNDFIKVDVKVGKVHYLYGSRAFTFSTGKKFPTCDIYVCVGLNESGEVERTYIIPSNNACLVTINIGMESKYNSFLNRWDYFEKYNEFYRNISC